MDFSISNKFCSLVSVDGATEVLGSTEGDPLTGGIEARPVAIDGALEVVTAAAGAGSSASEVCELAQNIREISFAHQYLTYCSEPHYQLLRMDLTLHRRIIDKDTRRMIYYSALDDETGYDWLKSDRNEQEMLDIASSLRWFLSVGDLLDQLPSVISDDERQKILTKIGKCIFLHHLIAHYSLDHEQIDFITKAHSHLISTLNWRRNGFIAAFLSCLLDPNKFQLLEANKHRIEYFTLYLNLFPEITDANLIVINRVLEGIRQLKNKLGSGSDNFSKIFRTLLVRIFSDLYPNKVELAQKLIAVAFEGVTSNKAENVESYCKRLIILNQLFDNCMQAALLHGLDLEAIDGVFFDRIEASLGGDYQLICGAGFDLTQIADWREKYLASFGSEPEYDTIFRNFQSHIHAKDLIFGASLINRWKWFVTSVLEGCFQKSRRLGQCPGFSRSDLEMVPVETPVNWDSIPDYRHEERAFVFEVTEDWKQFMTFNCGNCWDLKCHETNRVRKNLAVIGNPRYRIIRLVDSVKGRELYRGLILIDPKDMTFKRLTYHCRSFNTKMNKSDVLPLLQQYAETANLTFKGDEYIKA